MEKACKNLFRLCITYNEVNKMNLTVFLFIQSPDSTMSTIWIACLSLQSGAIHQ